MSVAITDPALLAQLTASGEEVLVTDAEGHFIGRFIHEPTCKLPAGLRSPFSEEEIMERRKDQSGRSIGEIFRDLAT